MSKFMDALVNFPLVQNVFQTQHGALALDAWNKFWLERADNIQQVMDRIPGSLDDALLTPVKNAAIWMDPVVETSFTDRRGKLKRKLEIVGNKYLKGLIVFKEDGSVQRGRVELIDPRKKGRFSYFRYNSHPVSGRIKRLLGRPSTESVTTHGHKGRWERDHLKVLETVDEKLLRELDGITNPMKLRRRFLSAFRKA